MGYLIPPSFRTSTPLWIAVLIVIKWTGKGLSCPSKCSCEQKAVNCSMKALDKVPGSIPLTTRELILSDNKLVTLPVLEMSYLNELVYLDCSHNLLEMGLDFTFPGIVKLTYLDLSFNKLSFVTPYTFSQLNKLLLLNLSSNPKLVEVKDKAFDSNPLLRFVDMSDCGLTYVGGELFKDLHNLRSLRLKGNPWNCDCSFLEFCNWMKKADVVYPDSEEMTCNKPELLKGLTLNVAETKLHYLCLVHLDFQDFVFLGLMAICIFFGGTLVAWLVGLATVIYYHPVMKVDEELDEEEYRMI
ncbi:leucine-rich repeat-containing protein 52-like [Podarcis lilfordi]|uniref:Leucine-rich repeat-containing protein 52-like n=1 Tax=Podarcis lilfordi TaxID=74358 RepID=A0AA35KFI3_9SAUR|nr:leucine-rich repeat-containing protein 52-like [Podarcis lilfordi]